MLWLLATTNCGDLRQGNTLCDLLNAVIVGHNELWWPKTREYTLGDLLNAVIFGHDKLWWPKTREYSVIF